MSTTLELCPPEASAVQPAWAGMDTRFVESEASVRDSLDILADLYNYNHWLFNKVRPFIRGRVCEVGCGIGNITQFLLNLPEVVGLEPSAELHARAQARFAQHLNLRFLPLPLDDCPHPEVPAGAYDTVVCLNVLEHIADDVGALSRMRALCARKGRVVILVPAHMCLYGRLDQSVGHYRRYTRRTLGAAFEAAGLRTTYSFYMNALGFFGWLWTSRILGREQIPVGAGRLFNRLVPFLDAAERLIPPPFGQSVVMIGTPA